MNIGLIGTGTVGSGVIYIDQNNADKLSTSAKRPFKLHTLCDLDFSKSPYDLSSYNLTSDWKELTNSSEIDVVVELIGGEEPARTIIETALKHGKHVVTANKLVIAKYGKELFALAKSHGVHLLFEAAVGGAVPIIKPLRTTLMPNHIKGIYGIVNGTTNFILTAMQNNGSDYAEVLKEAQKLGYAEADPTSDVGGFDSLYKLKVLAMTAFGVDVNIGDILVEGITEITSKDIEYCKDMGLVIKLLAIGQERDGQLELRVHPVMLSKDHALAAVNGVYNAIYVIGDAAQDIMFYGRGAGSIPTASSVWADLLDLINHSMYSIEALTSAKLRSLDTVMSEYYFRFQVKDKPGVLADIATILAKHGISVKNAVQKGLGDDAELVMITHTVSEAAKNEALSEIKSLSSVSKISGVIRVGI
jgi:homoserine dehydrogenase